MSLALTTTYENSYFRRSIRRFAQASQNRLLNKAEFLSAAMPPIRAESPDRCPRALHRVILAGVCRSFL